MIPQLRFRHVGMLVRDIDRMAAFYKDILGFVETDRGTASGVMIVFLTRDPSAHHQLVLSSGLPEPSGATRALQQLSFMVDSLDDLRQMYRNIWDRRDVSGLLPTDHGNAWSLYFRDPEQNRIEIYLDTPWHVAQPHHFDLDLSLSDSVIYRQTEQRVRADPSFKPVQEWRREQLARLRAAGIRVPD